MPKKRAVGVILKQSHLLLRSKSNSKQEGTSQDTSSRYSNVADSENIYQQPKASGPQKTFKNYLTGVFPSKKEGRMPLQQNNNILNMDNTETGTFSAYNVSHILNETLPKLHTDESNLSLNLLNFDTSHFGTAQKPINKRDTEKLPKSRLDKLFDTQKTKMLDQSLFGLNASKIEKENNPFFNITENSTVKESALIQHKLYSNYFANRLKSKPDIKPQQLVFPVAPSVSVAKENDRSLASQNLENYPSKVKPQKEKETLSSRIITENRSMNTGSYVLERRRRSKSTHMNVGIQVGKSEKSEKSYCQQSSKETGGENKDRLKRMIGDLEGHLKYLNRNLLNQKLINKKLANVKEQISIDTSSQLC